MNMSDLFADWRRPTFITSVNPGMLGYERLIRDMHPRVELVEIRLDGAWLSRGSFQGTKHDFAEVANLLRQAREQVKRPILATFRTEGGPVSITAEVYERLVAQAAKCADWVDVESNYPFIGMTAEQAAAAAEDPHTQEDNEKRVVGLLRNIHANGTSVILSRHCWEPSPNSEREVSDLLIYQLNLGADVSKAAFSPQKPQQLANLQQGGKTTFLLTHRPTILIGMGELGQPTRLAGPQMGNWGTFVTVGGPQSAPGQLPLAQLELRYPASGF